MGRSSLRITHCVDLLLQTGYLWGEVGVLSGLFAQTVDCRCDSGIARDAEWIRDVMQHESAPPAAKHHRRRARRRHR